MLPLFKGQAVLDGRHRDGNGYDEGRHQLHGGRRNIEAQGHRHNEAVQAAAEHDAQHPAHHGALAHQRLADDERSQCDGHHAGAHVDIAALLVLGQQTAGQGRQRTGDAQAHRDGKGRIDAGRPHHGGVVAGRPDGQAQPGAQKSHHPGTGQRDDHHGQHQLIPAARKGQRCFGQREDRVRLDQRQRRRKAHDRQIDGIKAGVHDDARHDALDAEAGLQKGCDETGAHTGRHRRQQGQKGVAGQCNLAGHSAAQREAAIGGQVCNIQNGIAQEQSQRNEGVDAAQFQRGLDHVERKDTRQHGVYSFS